MPSASTRISLSIRRPGLDRDFRGEPAAERESHQRERSLRQRVEESEVEMNEVVDRAEIRRTRRAAEAGMRRCDRARVTGEQFDDGQPRIDVLKTVEQQQRIACASAQHFELDTSDGHDIRGWAPAVTGDIQDSSQSRRLSCAGPARDDQSCNRIFSSKLWWRRNPMLFSLCVRGQRPSSSFPNRCRVAYHGTNQRGRRS
jgi:hypothetical protein